MLDFTDHLSLPRSSYRYGLQVISLCLLRNILSSYLTMMLNEILSLPAAIIITSKELPSSHDLHWSFHDENNFYYSIMITMHCRTCFA